MLLPSNTNNPYDLLKIPRNASAQAIEDAYDRLFDRYEADAQAGDPAAIEMLNSLNDARDILLDPKQRAALDRQQATVDRRPPASRQETIRSRPSPTARRPSYVRARPGSRLVDVTRRRTLASYLPYFIIMVFLAFGLSVAIAFLVNRGPTNRVCDTVATVNGVPICRDDLEERFAKDKAAALNDPIYGALFNNFQGITGTRALDLIKFDSLDKLINMEVILQQAKKEGNYPNDSQTDSMVTQAKASDLAPGQNFEDFLKQHGITAERYRRAVIENVTYTVMANQHLPKEGTSDEKTEGFMKWICDTRKNYDVKILITFTVTDNPPCTSGLPSDLPLPGIDTTDKPPEDIPTAVPAITPGTPATTPTAAGNSAPKAEPTTPPTAGKQ